MKKIYSFIFLLLFSFGFISNSFAINGDNVINNFVTFTVAGSESYVIPDGYDLFVENARIIHLLQQPPLGSEALINVFDSGSLLYSGIFEEGETFGDYNLVFRDSLIIENIDDHLINIVYVGYLFEEGSDLGLIPGPYTEELVSDDFILYFYGFEVSVLLIILTLVFIFKFINVGRFSLFDKIFIGKK